MTSIRRRSLIRGSVGIAAASALGRPFIANAQAKALGLSPAHDPANDGTFTFNRNSSYTFDPANRAVSGKYDFIGVVEHELSELRASAIE